jgi:hypothetical protein
MRWMLVLALAVACCGCSTVKCGQWAAPADFTTGIGEIRWLPSSDGRTIYWEVPYRNTETLGQWYSIFPSITVKEYDKERGINGNIVWIGHDEKNWYAAPGASGVKTGKIEIPAEAIAPTLKRETGSVPSARWSGEGSVPNKK